MGNLNQRGGGKGSGKPEDKKPLKKPDPTTITFGKKKKKKKGVDIAAKLPIGNY
jgi:hypothetical protein